MPLNLENTSSILPDDLLPKGGKSVLDSLPPDELKAMANQLRIEYETFLGKFFDFRATIRYGTRQEDGHLIPTHEYGTEKKPLYFSAKLNGFNVYTESVAGHLIICQLCMEVVVEQYGEAPSSVYYDVPIEAILGPIPPADD